MPYFQVCINGEIATVGGGELLDVLTFGILRASGTGNLAAQLTALRKTSSKNTIWLNMRISKDDVIQVKYLNEARPSPPELVWSSADDGAVTSEGLLAKASSQSALVSNPCKRFCIKFDDGKLVHVAGSESANLQLSITWSKVTNECKAEIGAIHIDGDSGGEVWVESILDINQHIEWRAE